MSKALGLGELAPADPYLVSISGVPVIRRIASEMPVPNFDYIIIKPENPIYYFQFFFSFVPFACKTDLTLSACSPGKIERSVEYKQMLREIEQVISTFRFIE